MRDRAAVQRGRHGRVRARAGPYPVAGSLSVNKALKVGRGVLAPTYYGGPETLLLVGDDTRKGYKYYHGYAPRSRERDAARADRSEQAVDLDDVDPAGAVGPDHQAGRGDLHEPAELGLHVGLDDACQDDQAGDRRRPEPRDRDHVRPVRERDRHARLRLRRRSTSAITTTTPTAATSTRTSTYNRATSASTASGPSRSSPTATPTPRRSATPATRASCSTSRSNTVRSSPATSAGSRGSSAGPSRPIPACAARRRSSISRTC